MKFRLLTGFLLGALAVGWAQKISLYTLLREDLFAGPLGNNMKRFQGGMLKVDQILGEIPNHPDAMALKGFGTAYLGIRALEGDDRAGFERLWGEGTQLLEQARAQSPSSIGVMPLTEPRWPTSRRDCPPKGSGRGWKRAGSSTWPCSAPRSRGSTSCLLI